MVDDPLFLDSLEVVVSTNQEIHPVGLLHQHQGSIIFYLPVLGVQALHLERIAVNLWVCFLTVHLLWISAAGATQILAQAWMMTANQSLL